MISCFHPINKQTFCFPRRYFLNLSKFANSSSTSQIYSINKRFNHPQLLMYNLVSRVDLYHEFIPYCTSSFVTDYDTVSEPKIAGLRVGFQSFDEEFTCDLQCNKPKLIIAKSVTHSLFRFLETEWIIEKIDEQNSRAILNLRYEFKSELYNKVSSIFAMKVASLMIKAFEKRAYNVKKMDNIKLKYDI